MASWSTVAALIIPPFFKRGHVSPFVFNNDICHTWEVCPDLVDLTRRNSGVPVIQHMTHRGLLLRLFIFREHLVVTTQILFDPVVPFHNVCGQSSVL